MADTISDIAVLPVECDLRLFHAAHAAEVASWVPTDEELRMLAPTTQPPLTAEKVAGWRRPGGWAYVLADGTRPPFGYVELNPMQHNKDQWWLGHVIVAPAVRGRGFGKRLIKLVLRAAFEQRRAKSVSLVVFPGNEEAILCYQRAGFTSRGREVHRFTHTGPAHEFERFEINARRWQAAGA